MASGAAHTTGYRVGLLALGALAAWGYSDDRLSAEQCVALLAGGVGGMLFDPDMRDQQHIRTAGEQRFYAVPLVGPLLGRLVEWYMWPLASVLPHRHWASHLPVVSTALIVIYLCVPPLFAVYLYAHGSTAGFLPWLRALYSPLWLYAFCAWAFQDTIHFVLDRGGLRD